MVGTDGRGGKHGCGRNLRGFVRKAAGGQRAVREIVLAALNLLLLAVHEVDVVAKVEMEILVAVARQTLLNGLELEQKVIAEGADQTERESPKPLNSWISVRRMEKTEGWRLRSSSGNSAGSGFRRPAKTSPSKPNAPSADGLPAPAKATA